MKQKRFNNMQIIALGFALMIFVGTVLLMLPVSSAEGTVTPFMTAFFTATSASCVTGLVLVDTAVHWSAFGQIVLLCLIQTGGLGFMSIATFFLSFFKKSINLKKRSIMAESINTEHISGLKNITRKIIIGTLIFEGTGALLLSLRFIPEFGFLKGIYYSVFHSVSAFCNAGFDLMGIHSEFSSLTNYHNDVLINVTLMILITVGGLGFLVWEDLRVNKLSFSKYQLHTKIVLIVSFILTFGGAALFYIFENHNTLSGYSQGDKILISLFSSVTCRTAGFNTVDFASVSGACVLIMCFLMFVGGSSGSTAGGTKTTSIAVIFSYLFANIRGVNQPGLFGRRFEDSIHKKAVTVCVFNLTLALSAAVIICAIQNFQLSDVLFEVFSAIGTVGMTRGITQQLNVVSQLIIIFLMFCGRVGSISFAMALLEKRNRPALSYPVESITVG